MFNLPPIYAAGRNAVSTLTTLGLRSFFASLRRNSSRDMTMAALGGGLRGGAIGGGGMGARRMMCRR
jgi:hypothetical protein